MNKVKKRNFILSIMQRTFLLLCFASPVPAQEYIIGQGDELSISFWQQSDLNTIVMVEQEGRIVLPLIGEITALGLSTSELSDKIVEKISNYHKDITQAVVVVINYGSNKIYITGHVLSPGKYTFAVIPNLWEAILEAGGASESALLSNINIIRGEIGRSENAENAVINLTDELERGDLKELPVLYPGDTIYVPGLAGEVGGLSSGGPQMAINYVYIYGEVLKSGVYVLEQHADILRTLVMVGGTTPVANLKEVVVISQLGRYPAVVKMDLEKYIDKGEPGMIVMNPGDTIYVPRKKDSIFGGVKGKIIGELLRVVLVTGSSMLIYSAVR